MYSQRFHFAISLLIAFLMLTTACDRNNCRNTVCPQNSECVKGECACIQGYEGANCDEFSYEKYVGSYYVSESCQTSGGGTGSSTNYSSTITQGNSIDRIYINGLGNLGLAAEAYINGNFLEIPNQNLGAATIQGSGTYEIGFNRIKIEYDYNSGGTYKSCTAYFQKQ